MNVVDSPAKNRSNCVAFDGAGEFLKTVRLRVHAALASGQLKGAPRLQRKKALGPS